MTGVTNLGVGAINKAAEFLPEKARKLAPKGKVEFPSLPYPSQVAYEQLQKAAPSLKPENKAEERWQEFAGDVGTLFSPVGGLKKDNFLYH